MENKLLKNARMNLKFCHPNEVDLKHIKVLGMKAKFLR